MYYTHDCFIDPKFVSFEKTLTINVAEEKILKSPPPQAIAWLEMAVRPPTTTPTSKVCIVKYLDLDLKIVFISCYNKNTGKK